MLQLRVSGLCSPQFRLCLPWLPDTLLKWTPFAFMTFGRCTVADPSISSSKSSQEARRTALPTSPCVSPAECNSLRGHGSLSCGLWLVFPEPPECDNSAHEYRRIVDEQPFDVHAALPRRIAMRSNWLGRHT